VTQASACRRRRWSRAGGGVTASRAARVPRPRRSPASVRHAVTREPGTRCRTLALIRAQAASPPSRSTWCCLVPGSRWWRPSRTAAKKVREGLLVPDSPTPETASLLSASRAVEDRRSGGGL